MCSKESEQYVLSVFVKNKGQGKAKTRIAQRAGDERALDIYTKLLYYTLHQTRQLNERVNIQVLYSDYIVEGDLWDQELERVSKKKQKGRGLGERMLHCFRDNLENDRSANVLIGSDCAELKPSHLEKAFKALKEHDIVIGPAEDGGYYLIGMKKVHPAVFKDIAWSTGEVFSQTMDAAKTKGLEVAVLEKLNDVDYLKDWEKVKENVLSVYDQYHHSRSK